MATWHGNRRSILRLAAAFLGGGAARCLFANRSTGFFEDLLHEAQGGTLTSLAQRYQVNASIAFAGISLFAKKNVGGAVLTFQQSTWSECRLTALQFAAGSWPEHLKGFNRFGMTEEMVREESGAVSESAYVSFMSSSPEKDFSEARQAFAPQEYVPLSIALGHSSVKGCAAQLQHDKVPGNYDWRNCQDIIDEIRSTATPSPANARARVPVLPTFLYAVRKAIAANDGQPVRYAHNAKLYSLTTRAGSKSRNDEFEIIGRILAEADGTETEFKAWMPAEEPTGLPLRIQWKARSFLLLTLQADNTVKPPELRSLLRRERA